MDNKLVIAGRTFNSRLIIGTGKYRTNEEMVAAFERSGAELITVAVRRVNLTDRSQPSLLDFIDLKKFSLLQHGGLLHGGRGRAHSTAGARSRLVIIVRGLNA